MPTLELELSIRNELGIQFVAGIDEAGRGAIAGPVVAAAVILPIDDPDSIGQLAAVDDSKRVRPAHREELFDKIIEFAVTFGIGSVDSGTIDELGIIPANAAAMKAAIAQLDPAPDFLLIDGRMRLKDVPTRQQAVVRGDGVSLSIAAASILAKVTRDRQMIELDRHHPSYGLGRHKGYCTQQHVEALERLGPSVVHRRSFAPIRWSLFPP